jgi:thioesterase domain-containing protein
MGSEQPIYVLRGLGPKLNERPYTTAEQEGLAKLYVEEMRKVQPNGPYYVGGMCEGGIIASHMARQIEALGERVALLAIMDTWPRENTRHRLVMKFGGYVRKLRSLSGIAAEERRRLLAKAFKNRIHWLIRGKSAEQILYDEVYWPKNFVASKIDAKITLFRVPKQFSLYVGDPLLGWGSRTNGGVEVHMINGMHRFLFREPSVGEVATTLVDAIDRASAAEMSLTQTADPCGQSASA